MLSSGGTVVEERIISSEDIATFSEKRYRLTSVTPLVENPKLTVRELNQVQLDIILDNYGEYAEFIVRLEQIDDV